MCYVNSCYDAQKKSHEILKQEGRRKERAIKEWVMVMVFQAAEVCCQHMFARLYINRVINRSITRSLADSCDFKTIRLRAAAHITSFLKTDPHKGIFISLCVCGPILHTIVMWETQCRKDKTKVINTMKISHAIHRLFFSKYMKILF